MKKKGAMKKEVKRGKRKVRSSVTSLEQDHNKLIVELNQSVLNLEKAIYDRVQKLEFLAKQIIDEESCFCEFKFLGGKKCTYCLARECLPNYESKINE